MERLASLRPSKVCVLGRPGHEQPHHCIRHAPMTSAMVHGII